MREKHALHGLCILNTRPLEQSRELSEAIGRAQGKSIDVPALEIESTGDSWVKKWHHFGNVQYAIFISQNAVTHFFSTLKQHHLPWSDSIEIIAIGKASAKALKDLNRNTNHIPLMADSEHLLQLEALQQVQGQSILLIKGEGGNTAIAEGLLARGANVIPIEVYRRVLPKIPYPHLPSLWRENAVDIILFTSRQSMHNLFALFGPDAHSWLCNTPCLVISTRLAQEARKLGMKTILISRYDTIMDTLEHYVKGLFHDNNQRR